MTIILTHSLDKEQQELVQRCLNVYSITGEIKDILYANIKETVKKHQFIVTFGKIPASLVNTELEDLISKPIVVNLPHPKQLVDIPENQKHRRLAANELSRLTSTIKEAPIDTTTLTVTPDDLPLLDKQGILLLQKLSETKSNIVFSKNGTLVEVGNERRGTAEVFFTIEELFLLQGVMETFDVTEVQILKDE